MKNYLLGCDWGTTSFRLRLIDTTDLQLIGEVTSQEGVASTFTNWKATGDQQGIPRKHFFRQQLARQIALLSAKTAIDLVGVPVVISGMASSSIGMDEVPYASLPFPTDGSLASTRRLLAQDDFPHDLTLISGVRTQHDVMRGEETQLIGLLDLLDNQQLYADESILIFPGTHSKHIYIQQQQVIDFHTFMTGELFNLMAYHSILKDSVEPIDLQTLSESDRRAFVSGINDADSSILNDLFKVRTNQLFNKLTKKQNALYLSGLLIGDELKTLTRQPQWQLILCSGNNLYELYKLAIEVLALSDRTLPISASLIDKATMVGQLKIAQHQHLPLPK